MKFPQMKLQIDRRQLLYSILPNKISRTPDKLMANHKDYKRKNRTLMAHLVISHKNCSHQIVRDAVTQPYECQQWPNQR